MSYVQVQPGGKANAKGSKYVNLAWNEWDAKRKRSVQRRFYVGRITPEGGDVVINKRFTGGGEVRVPLAEVRARAAERAGFEAWLRGLAGGPAAADGVARVDVAGDAWLIRHLAEASGLREALEAVFGPADGGTLAGLAAHLFFDPARHAEAAARLERLVLGLAEKAARETFRHWREAKQWIAENAGARAACLRVDASGGAPRVVPKPNRVAAATARAGYTLVLTRGREAADETPEAALRDYRLRDLAEKLFDAFKTEHGQYRLRTACDDGVQGRFFLGFLTLALRAELETRMRAAGLHKSATDANVLDELGKAKALVTRKGTRVLLEVSKKQRALLAALKVPELA